MNSVTIKDVGAINHLDITFPPDGGVIVLRGKNGTGKTTALTAAESLIRGSGKLTTRDDAKGSGRVDGFGATLILGRKTTRAGVIEVESVAGKLSIADLVEPPLKDPAAADRQRIKALIGMEGTTPSADLFKGVICDDLIAYVSEATWANKDLLDVANKAKRDLETKAREKEDEAKIREGQARTAAGQAEDLDLSCECDEQTLRESNMAASNKWSVLRDRERAATEAENTTYRAQQRLEKLQAEYTGPTVKESEASVGVGIDRLSKQEDVIQSLKDQMAKELAIETKLSAELTMAKNALDAAVQYVATVEECKSILDSTSIQAPDPGELEEAEQAATDSAKAVEDGAIVRRAKVELGKAEKFREQANEAADIGMRLRQSAGQIDDVLSAAIKTPLLFVRDGRLYTMHATRGETLFGELSEGERWTMAFDIAAPMVGEHGIIVLPQGAYESLDPGNRAHVGELARERKLYVLTAEVTAGELRAEHVE